MASRSNCRLSSSQTSASRVLRELVSISMTLIEQIARTPRSDIGPTRA
jgi:hypothetical protein